LGGLALAKSLRKADVQIVLLDKNNYHTFQPLLYQVATGRPFEADSIAYSYPVRYLKDQKKLSLSLGGSATNNTDRK